MLLSIVFCIVFTIAGVEWVKYLKERLKQHNVTNKLLSTLIAALPENKEDNDMGDEK